MRGVCGCVCMRGATRGREDLKGAEDGAGVAVRRRARGDRRNRSPCTHAPRPTHTHTHKSQHHPRYHHLSYARDGDPTPRARATRRTQKLVSRDNARERAGRRTGNATPPRTPTMGLWISRLLNLFGDQEARILVLGLDNAGKTTILCASSVFRVARRRRRWRERARNRRVLTQTAPLLLSPRPTNDKHNPNPNTQTVCRSARSSRPFRVSSAAKKKQAAAAETTASAAATAPDKRDALTPPSSINQPQPNPTPPTQPTKQPSASTSRPSPTRTSSSRCGT